jgi:hypothetical protein
MQVKFYFYCSIFNQMDVSKEQQSGQTRVAAAETLVEEYAVFCKE